MGRHHRATGRHRAPSTVGRTAARVTAAGAVVTAPLASAMPAQAEGMPPHVRDAIIACESGGHNIEHGGDPGGVSTASGFFQFVNSSWLRFGGAEFAPRAIDATKDEQTAVADRAFAANGLRDWEASRGCWEPRVGARHASGREAPPPVHSVAPRHAKPATGDYTVKAGDTLGEIAAAHGTTWQKLYAANRDVVGANPHLIFPGQRLDV